MARYVITTTVEGSRKDSVEKILRTAFKGQEPIVYCVEKQTSPESRTARLQDAAGIVEDAKAVVEELRDEMQEWFDSIPENLQAGAKADEVQEAITALEELQGEMESLSFDNVSFPGMF